MSDSLNVIPSGDESGSPLGNKDLTAYTGALVDRLWRYRRRRFSGRDELFDRSGRSRLRPPVFGREYADSNLILDPSAGPERNAAVVGAIPVTARHRWFRGMKSSQALTQSVFANLSEHGKLGLLAGLETPEGEPAFFELPPATSTFTLERQVRHLGEPTSTSVDVMIEGAHRVGVECKFTEWEVGSCSRPTMEDDDPRYCDGGYHHQTSRVERCQLTSIGVRYWEHIPRLFEWSAREDHQPCPVRFTFQLVRNVLAACVSPDGAVDRESHCLLVYDERNPAFQIGGAALRAWEQVREGLRAKQCARRVSWQSIMSRVAADPEMQWLASEIEQKYGISGS